MKKFFILAILFTAVTTATAQNPVYVSSVSTQTCDTCQTSDPIPQKPTVITPEIELLQLLNEITEAQEFDVSDEKWFKRRFVFEGVKMQIERKGKIIETVRSWEFWQSRRQDDKNLPTKIFFLITDSGKFVFSLRNLAGYKKTTMLVSKVKWDVFVIDPTMVNFELKI